MKTMPCANRPLRFGLQFLQFSRARILRLTFIQIANSIVCPPLYTGLPTHGGTLLPRPLSIKSHHATHQSSTRHSSARHNKHNTMDAITSVYPTGTTVVQPVAVAQPRYAVYDKPADRRLRPWIILGSVLLGVCFLSSYPLPIPQTQHLASLSSTSSHHITHPSPSVYGRCYDHLHIRR